VYIRRATHHDLFMLEALMKRGLREADEANLPFPPIDFLHSAHAVLNLIAAGAIHVVCEPIDEQRERMIGAHVFDVRQYHWNPGVKFFETIHWYIHPDHRGAQLADGRTAAAALIDSAKELAMSVGLPFLMTVQFTPDRASVKDALIDRKDFQYMGGSHLFVPPKQEAAEAAE
jgi:hypothetical protein